jgi:hypothetical protein
MGCWVDKHLPAAAKSLYRSIFYMMTFCIAFYESYISTYQTILPVGWVRIRIHRADFNTLSGANPDLFCKIAFILFKF